MRKEDWGGRLARHPWSADGVNLHLLNRYQCDEAVSTRFLHGEGSTACRIYRDFRRGGATERSVNGKLQCRGAAQVSFSVLIRATAKGPSSLQSYVRLARGATRSFTFWAVAK